MSTSTPQNCTQCGAPLPPNAKAGLCPRCVMEMNLATQTEFTGEVGPHGTKVIQQAPTPAELADKFPQLEILELLGRGGMGAVYKARQKELDRIVALKILPPGIGQTPGFAERFTREAKALAKLHHPNIVTLFEFGRSSRTSGRESAQTSSGEDQSRLTSAATGELYYFLMEFVDGVNLRQLLDSGRVASREALAIVPQICDALQFAHDHGIVHRDIKPENILMDRRGRVKVADFGLVKLVGTERGPVSRGGMGTEETQENSNEKTTGEAAEGHRAALRELTDTGKIMGTPQYMAPEQKDRPFEVDHRADIYALGVVFYQMLTGELPGVPIAPPSSRTGGVQIDVRLDEIVLRALEKNPDLRYAQASLLRTEVETVAAGGRSVERIPPRSNASGIVRTWTWIGIVNSLLVLTILLWFITERSFSLPAAVIAVFAIATTFDFAVMRPHRGKQESSPPAFGPPAQASPSPTSAQPRDDQARRNKFRYLLGASVVGLIVGEALRLPFVWGASIGGIIISALNLKWVFPDVPEDKKRRALLLSSLIVCVIGLPIGMTLKLPLVWGLSVAGIIIGGAKLLAWNRSQPCDGGSGNGGRQAKESSSEAACDESSSDRASTYHQTINQAEWENPDNLIGPKWLSVYFSKRDSRIWVPKQELPLGWTINVGRPGGLTWLFVIILGLPALIIAASMLAIANQRLNDANPAVEAPQNQHSSQITNSRSAAFGPVIERVLQDPDNGSGRGNEETLNLRTGKLLSVLDQAPKQGGGRLQALVANEGDLFAEVNP